MKRISPPRNLPVVTHDGYIILIEDIISAAREKDLFKNEWHKYSGGFRQSPAGQYERMMNQYLSGRKIGTMARELGLAWASIHNRIESVYKTACRNAGGTVARTVKGVRIAPIVSPIS